VDKERIRERKKVREKRRGKGSQYSPHGRRISKREGKGEEIHLT